MQHDFLLVTGKKSAEIVANPAMASNVAGNVGAAATSATASALTLPTLGLAAAVSAALTQIEYKHKNRAVVELYRDELAAKLHKSRDNLSSKDLDLLAGGDASRHVEGNRVIAQAVAKNRSERNVGLGTSVVSTVASLLAVHEIVSLGVIAAGTATGIIAQMAAALVIYNAVKAPLTKISHKIFGLDKRTTHDRIAEIKRDREAGKSITREQVFSVFVSAAPELDSYIQSQFGAKFDELDVAQKQQAAAALGPVFKVEQIADAINQGVLNTTELAFTVQGDWSGVMPKAPVEKPGKLAGVVGKIKAMFSSKTQAQLEVVELPAHAQEIIVVSAPAQEAPQKTFVERLGLAKSETSLGHVERLQQAAESATAQR